MRRHKRLDPPVAVHRGNHDIITRIVERNAFTENTAYLQIITAINKWDAHMARKTYRIELKIDFTEESNHEIMIGIAKQYARDLLGSAMLLQDRGKPQVALITDDSFHGSDEIDIMPEGESLHS